MNPNNEQYEMNLDARKSSVNEELLSIDWSFKVRAKPPPLEAIHPYPAKFIGEIPRALIQSIPIQKGTAVLDPFAGSGTTLLEAQRAGVPSVGVDLNPIACLITQVKTSPTPVNLIKTTEEVYAAAKLNNTPKQWDIPNVNHWFKPDVQNSISCLLEEINKIPKGNKHNALKLALSSILVRVSNQDSDTRYAAIEKNISGDNVFDLFLSASKKLNKTLAAREWDLVSAKIIQENILSVNPKDLGRDIGLVVTSPPYPNAYEYWLYHKYRMWWLGFNPLEVKEKEIGARAHFFKKKPHTEENFFEQMKGTLSLIDNVLVKNGYICFVIGRSKIHGKVIDNADIIQSAASEYNLSIESRFDREIASSRKSFNLSHANIKTETILVLKKG